MTYPSGNTVNYAYDNAGRATSMAGNLGEGGPQRDYATGIIYDAGNRMTKEQFGTTTPIFNKLFYNVRGQLAEIRAGTSYTGPTDTNSNRGAIVNRYSNQAGCVGASCNAADNNGNLMQQDIYIPDNDTFTQFFEYDSLNRLDSARETRNGGATNWRQAYTYDRYGNRSIKESGTTQGVGINSMQASVVQNTLTNRMYAPGETEQNHPLMNYDLAGNQTRDYFSDPNNIDYDSTYDAENHLKTTTATYSNPAGTQVSTYSYDGDGRRVKRTISSTETWQIYGVGGELVAEYGLNAGVPSLQKEYGYRNGQLLVTAAAPSGGSSDNVALAANGATISSSTTYGTQAAANTINGDRKGLNASWWTDNTSFGYPDWIEVRFAGAKTINEIDVIGLQENNANPSEPTSEMTSYYALGSFTVEYWTGSAWATVPGGIVTGNTKVWRQFNFASLTTSKIRVYVTAVAGDNHTQVVEVEAYTAPVTNFALAANGATTIGSTTSGGQAAANAINGDRKGLKASWWTDNTSFGYPDWIEVRFAGAKTINEIDVIGLQENYGNPSEPTSEMTSYYALSSFTVEYWTGSEWAAVPGEIVTGNTKVWRKFKFAALTTSKIRMQVTNVAGDNHTQVVEVEAYGPEGSGGTSNINWLVTDQLGTPRMIFDQTGALGNVKRHDYLPFGEELDAGQGGRTTAQDNVRQKFTSKERDIETGLDYFGRRYYGSFQGRFTTTDPVPVTKENFLNPQRWNLYVYVNNNPLAAVDPNGGDGQGNGGDKVITVFLDYGVNDLGSKRIKDGRTRRESDVPNKPADWQGISGKGNNVKLFGNSDVTGNKGLPQLITHTAFENALKNSDVVLYVGHGRGDTSTAPFQQQGIQVGMITYTPSGTGVEPPFTGSKPEATASLVANMSCDANANGGSYFTFVGQNQVMVTLDSRGDGALGGVTSYNALDKATAAFVKTYVKTGSIEKAVKAANKVLSREPGDYQQNVGDEVKQKKVN